MARSTQALESIQRVEVLLGVTLQRDDVIAFEAAGAVADPAPVVIALEDTPAGHLPPPRAQQPVVMTTHPTSA